MKKLAVILIVISCVLYGLIAVVPFLPVRTGFKVILVPVLIATGEITWWAGIAIVGKQVITKYFKYLNPRNWCRGSKKI